MADAVIDAVLARIDADIDESVERLFALLRIASISTDPDHARACAEAANWCADTLNGLGFAAGTRPTPGHPMVVGHRTDATAAGPHVLFYGHYDVQPVDPLELWHTDPFAPRLAEDEAGRKVIVARGAADDKGQLLTFVEACRAWIAVHGRLPVPVTILFEGEEESGSPSLVPFLEANAKELSHDVALICDTGMWDRETPAINSSLRGLVGEEIVITAASKDLHSGLFGGAARNPNHVLAKILADLHDENGHVRVPGFYDGVAETPAAIRAQWDSLGMTAETFLGGIGLKYPAGEGGRSVLEQVWARPTAEVNGMIGGYTGPGFKTVIPSRASAKVSFRLVGGQDPETIRAAFREFVAARVPGDCSVAFHAHGGSPGLSVDIDSPHMARSLKALSDEWPKPAVVIGSGGSIPIVGYFKDILGMDSLLIGFGHADDQIHSPNEKYDLASFHKGIRSWARVLAELAE